MDYKKTVLVGKTEFPMRANLAQREPKRLAQWQASGIYERLQRERREAGLPRFVLHDGPPYANGHIHLGTALNKVLKDMIIRSRSMDGHCAPYVPGWDCHGLPVELQAMRDVGLNLDALSPVEFRHRCRDYAIKYLDIQREEFRRLGVWGDWDEPYVTMNPEYEATQIEIFGHMALKGFIYKGRKPVYWCTDCQTALAEAEIEYHDHVSWSIYVRFLVTDDRQMLQAADHKTYVLIWTTTPWTLPANLAVALNPQLNYALVRVAGEQYILAEELVPTVAEELQWSDYSIEGRFVGSDLEGIVTRHPFVDRSSPLILGDHVTLEAGTGCVHTAPGHGLEDYQVGVRYGLDIFAPVDSKGRFTSEAGAYAEMLLSDANQVIVEDMRRSGSLMKDAKIEHQYPHCWRCKNPVIFRATEQWFASVDGFREEALAAIEQVKWIPHWGIDRISGMVKDRHDWCISRQRLWGVPIPVFYCQSCEAYLVTEESIAAVASLFREHGADAWWTHEAEEILPKGTACQECGGRSFRKETDIMDVWFDSGSSHAAVCAKHPDLHWPADMYLEGSDQHRGWFQSSLLTSVAAFGKPPFRSVLTHGFIVDAEGHKMSKSVGNVIAPEEIINKYGADILRLWVASADYRGDITISENILEQTAEVYRRIRNTARFMLANIGDFRPEHKVPYAELPELDKWALMRAERLYQRVVQAYRDCEFHVLHQAIHNFCAVDMGGFYLDVLKDILYCDAPDSLRRRSAQTVLCDMLITLVQLVAPVLPFTAEEIWEYLPPEAKDKESVHLTLWRPLRTERLDAVLERRWEQFFNVRKTVARALEQARTGKLIGSSNEATIHIYVDKNTRQHLESFSDLPILLMVSEVHIHDTDEDPVCGLTQQQDDIRVVLRKAESSKCERCWRHDAEVGTHEEHPSLCTRCFDVVTSL